jgi:hypothetical protein
MLRARVSIAAGTLVGIVLFAGIVGSAHKPITSPFTFNEDVFPIVRDRCASCHVPDGVAPMSLMTHADAVPWGESIRAELVTGHMPPWPVETARDRFRNAGGLTARELNVLLTWATGGTPPGDPAKAPSPVAVKSQSALGSPDLELPLSPVTITADEQDHLVSFTVATGVTERRRVRAVDLRPGTPAVVRSARIVLKTQGVASDEGVVPAERLLALWTPGDPPIALDGAAGFDLPAGAELSVSIRYKKTWQYERKEMRDQSRIGLYFGDTTAAPVRALRLRDTGQLDADMHAIAIYPDPELSGVTARVEIVRPDGTRDELIALRAQADWARRYWFKEPITLPKGTRYSVRYTTLEGASKPSPAEARRMTLDVFTDR